MNRPIAIFFTVVLLACAAQPVTRAAEPHESTSRPRLAFSPSRDFSAWQAELREELCRVMALPAEADTELHPTTERDAETDEYTMDRISFEAESGETVPGYLLYPKAGTPPYPTMICLQGHAPGMHISIGRAKTAKEESLIRGGRDIALQSVRHGWAALVIEQRAFGERAEEGISCNNRALCDLLKGRPLTGQRVYDVMRAVDFIGTQADLDSERIGCMGNSAGGTVTFYAACVDPRIRLAIVSCSFGTFESTWLYKQHCSCGYLPSLLKVADMPDLAGLIAPRSLLIVAGKQDYLARFDGVLEGYQVAQKCYLAAGHADRVTLSVGELGHQFYPELAWPVIQGLRDEWSSATR